jgi:hypothetical protein
MTINAEEIVQIALTAHSKAYGDKGVDLQKFELEIRRMLMQRENKTFTTYTYTTTPPNLTGTWKSNVITNNQELLHG